MHCTINKNTDFVSYLQGEVNAVKIKYMAMSCELNAGQNQNIKTSNTLLKWRKVQY